MLYRLIILFLVVLGLLFTNCQTDSGSLLSLNNIDESLGYFPINTGNKWIYKRNGYDNFFSYDITKKISINDTEYFIFSNADEFSHADTIRIDGNIIWNYSGGQELVWFNFDLDDNSDYKYKLYDVHVSTGLKVNTYLGEFSDCITFYFDIPAVADEEQGYVFAKGIGIVRMPGAWVDLRLYSFSIKR